MFDRWLLLVLCRAAAHSARTRWKYSKQTRKVCVCVCVCVSGRLCDAVGAAQCSATKQSSDARVAFLLFPFSSPFGPRVPSTMSTRRPPLFSLACPSPFHPTTLLLYKFKRLNGVGRESYNFIYVFPSKLVRASPEGSPEERRLLTLFVCVFVVFAK